MILNIPVICLSLKYINKNYELISNVSKWIYFELTKLNYKESKFVNSLNKKDFESIETLIKFNQNKDLLSKYLIEYSCSGNYFNIIKLFIENGANIHSGNDYILRRASHHNHANIVKFLIENGADIHARDDEALRYADHFGHIGIVKFLVDNGANKDLVRRTKLN